MKKKLLLLLAVVIFATSVVAFGRDHERKIHRSEFMSINNLNYAQDYKIDKRDEKFTKRFGRNESQRFEQRCFDRNESPKFGQKRFGRNESPRFEQKRFGRNESPRFGQRGFGRNGKQMMRHQRFNKSEDLSYIMTHSVLLDEVNVYAKRIIKTV